DEFICEEELRGVAQAIDDQINRGVILKIPASTKRSEQPVPRKVQPELKAAPTWALLTRQHNTVDIEIGTGRLGYGVAWGFSVSLQLPTDRRGTRIRCAGDRLVCKADENGEGP